MGKYALLVGISNYTVDLNPLPSAIRDVGALRQVLVDPDIGDFAESDVVVLIDSERWEIEDAIYHLFDQRKANDLLLFYFSGHGVTDSRDDFYLTGISTRKDKLLPTAVSSDFIHKMMNQSRSQRQIIILDCCHSGAFPKGMKAKDIGMVNILPKLGGKGRAILTASASGEYAFEQAGFDLSLYTHFLVEGLKTGAADLDKDGEISIDELYEYVRDQVKRANDRMSPEFYPVKEGYSIILAKAPQCYPNPAKNEQAQEREEQLNQQIFQEFEPPQYQENSYDSSLIRIPLSRRNLLIFLIFGGGLLSILSWGVFNPKTPKTRLVSTPSTFNFKTAKVDRTGTIIKREDLKIPSLTYTLADGINLELVKIPAGKFKMGSESYTTELPTHEVTLQSFWMGKYTITNAQWESLMGTRLGGLGAFKGKNQPVVYVSYFDAKRFCKKLSEIIGRSARLPSEAEWEYACRAGTITPYYFGDLITQDLVNYAGGSNGKTSEVENFIPNAWGLHQMHGNVREWCSDIWHDNYRGKPEKLKINGNEPWGESDDNQSSPVRGGAWTDGISGCRSSSRLAVRTQSDNSYAIGFRVVVA